MNRFWLLKLQTQSYMLGRPLGEEKLTFALGGLPAFEPLQEGHLETVGASPSATMGTTPPWKRPAVTRSLQLRASSLCLPTHSLTLFPSKTQGASYAGISDEQ